MFVEFGICEFAGLMKVFAEFEMCLQGFEFAGFAGLFVNYLLGLEWKCVCLVCEFVGFCFIWNETTYKH